MEYTAAIFIAAAIVDGCVTHVAGPWLGTAAFIAVFILAPLRKD